MLTQFFSTDISSLYFGLAVSTFIVWPLPLLHGRKPYLLAALALALPLQFPQALIVSQRRSPKDVRFRTGLLCARAATGLVLGFANVNYITVLLDLFGASLQSKNPHQEFVVPNDVRRHGGGMGMWLGIWSWCWIASLAVGFQVGAAIIESISPDWGFYVVIFILVGALILNILAPETRRAAYRRSVTEVYDRNENYITRRVSRGECKLHISTEGPLYWFEEVWAGMKLVFMMMFQSGFFVMSFYLGWLYAQIMLVIILLGALLSRDYRWQPRHVGAGVTSIAIGAFLAVPLTKAGIFSRERKSAFRTDSMTFQKQVTWSSHLVRRAIFMLTLPLMGLAYTLGSAGRPSPWIVPLVFAGALGFLSLLAIAECHGIIMETFDTCDLQPGVNTRHRFESMAVQDRRRRTNYTSFPRVSAGIFASQTIAFILAGVATLVGGNMTRRLGAQKSTGSTAGILLGLTLLLTAVLWRFREVQVIPNHTFGTRRDTAAWAEFKDLEKIGRGADWKAVVIGHPSGKMRRMNVLEMGALSRWTEIRKLNYLIKGPRLGEDTKTGTFRGN
jgi:MFS family permease